MYDVMAYVLAGGPGERLGPLTIKRTKPAVPFAGKYRIIDFVLSNIQNSKEKSNLPLAIKPVVIIQAKKESLSYHLQDGWSHLVYTRSPEEEWYRGSADAVRQNTQRMGDADYVMILCADHIYKMDYSRMLDFHRRKKADVTISAIEIPKEDASRFGCLEIDSNNEVTHFEEKPDTPPESGSILGSMGVYIFNANVLNDAFERGGDDFGKDIIRNNLNRYSTYGYDYTKENIIEDYVYLLNEDGIRKKIRKERIKDSEYWKDIGTVDAFFEANMDLVKDEPLFDVYGELWPIHTFNIPNPPAKVLDGNVDHSHLSDGSIVSGKNSTVSYSIISPDVCIENSEIVESILFTGVQVGKNARLRRTIVDKYVTIPAGTEIGYDMDYDKSRGLHVENSGIVVVPKDFVFPES